MRIFQSCFFIIEIIFWLLLGTIIALYPNKLFGTEKYTEKQRPQFIYLEKTYERKRFRIRKFSLWKIIWIVIVMGITVYFTKPYFLDIPQFVTGKLNYVIGKVVETKHYSKDPTEYVYLSTGEKVEFFFSSGVSKNNCYKIGYLTHTKRAIYCEEIDISSNYRKVAGFPFKQILWFFAILGALFFLAFLSQYLKLKLFIITNVLSIPIFIYYFVKYGTEIGIWFTAKSVGFIGLISALVFIPLILLMYYIQKWKSDDFIETYFIAQLFSISELGFLIILVFNLE